MDDRPVDPAPDDQLDLRIRTRFRIALIVAAAAMLVGALGELSPRWIAPVTEGASSSLLLLAAGGTVVLTAIERRRRPTGWTRIRWQPDVAIARVLTSMLLGLGVLGAVFFSAIAMCEGDGMFCGDQPALGVATAVAGGVMLAVGTWLVAATGAFRTHLAVAGTITAGWIALLVSTRA